MSTKYTAKYGWKAAKAVLYGFMLFVLGIVLEYLYYTVDVSYILNDMLSVRDLNTWSEYSALFVWVYGGAMMLLGLVLDMLTSFKFWVIRTVDKIDARFKKA